MRTPTSPDEVPTVALGTLTDAEIVVLARPYARIGVQPVRPAWSRLDPSDRAAARLEARRSLVARGLVDLAAHRRVAVRGDLRSALALRAAATAVVAVVRTTSAGRDHWYAHLVHDVVVLEQVAADGIHHFALTAAATLPHHVVAAVLHPGATLLRADVELRTIRRMRRWSWEPRAPEAVDPDDVRRAVDHLVTDLADREGCP